MSTVTIEEAQATLLDLIHRLQPDEEVVITENNQPVARLITAIPNRSVRKLGTLKGTVLYMAPDFDAPLEDFKEYME
jgi:prevent-host-death family protein